MGKAKKDEADKPVDSLISQTKALRPTINLDYRGSMLCPRIPTDLDGFDGRYERCYSFPCYCSVRLAS